ncbi:putative amino acid permease C3H1.09c [Wickerhamomyces ciferrii]|uniref:Amino acid permease C3H1.09c n=1 Tax=Wickerhamomyces ciferrii (strain ATCC 14091 / BCRC 22168 / CBS 111 / JCM 3599 / NBRC 0793 / NRRL Y-1031 F-60-10) TaxID=1206466 RepID=K0KFG9_WICCF|nr:putative amino acid permease C3H1.09c [Wickerhamomyces ciferrii]CCH43870.1 putative amino acid permease C3H1.09c [Wickerhamomyces ciferrii]
MTSSPKDIDNKRSFNQQNSIAIGAGGSYNSISNSVPNVASRRYSTQRLGSPAPFDNSPRARSFHLGVNNSIKTGISINQASSSNLKKTDSLYSSSNSSQNNQVLIDADSPSFAPDFKDQNVLKSTANLYFNDGNTILHNEGGDITREIKHKGSFGANSLKRTKSSSDLMDSRRGSTASALNVPGGFRREFIVNKARERAILNDEELKKVPFLTKNFMEFLYIYGHFAGESFDEDFEFDLDQDHSGDSEAVSWDETTPLVASNQQGQTIRYEAKGTTSTLKAFLIMLKSFVGTGVLFLPKAFSNGGLTFSSIMLAIFGIYSYYCYYILVVSKNATKVSSFGDIGGKLYGGWMKNLILISLVLTQIGFACAYIIFTTGNLTAFFNNVTNFNIQPDKFFLLQTIVFIPLSFIRNVSKLSLPSFMANFFIMAGLLIVLFFTTKEIIYNGVKPVETFINKSKFSLFIGTAIFAFEGIGLIIPVQDSMRHPEKFPLVLGLVIITITIMMITIAAIGYLAYGEDIQTVILLNLPQSNFFVNLIQFFYSLAILLSTPLQLFPAIGIIEKRIFQKSNSGKFNNKTKWLKNFFRTLFVGFCMNIAWFGANDLDKFVSFVGCFACIPLVYMYPPLLHYKSSTHGDFWGKVLDIVLVIIGGAAMSYTSYQIIHG